ncbi:quercetin dioxygenase-like cupin family protein [Paraburkholderia sp. WC7.3g]|uniref:cupin domain-containing protein n=1 Tax=Paraburkholderia sp. WC7.3g TaxID=2991070 RepID=UPI003D22AA81
MKMTDTRKSIKGGNFFLTRPEDAERYWQPLPANGHVALHVAPHLTKMDAPLAAGTQTLGKGSHVRNHSHDNNEEVLHFLRGEGKVVIDGGATYEITPGTTLFLGKGCAHTFINESADEEMHWFWFMSPAGLESFFQQIGRPRVHGEPSPEPFPRPENVAEIEANTVFAAPKRDQE